MKILYVNKVSPRFGGGAELRLLEIGKRLAAKGHTVHVICSKTEPNLPDYEQIQGIHTHYISLLPAPIFRFRRLTFYLSRYLFYFLSWSFGNLVKQISPDVIIDVISPSPSLIYLLARRKGVKCCAEVMEYRGNQWFKMTGFLNALLGWSSQFLLHNFKFDKFIAISKFTKNELIKAGFESKDIEIIPCGVNINHFKIDHFIEREKNSAIILGRLVPQKGHILLFDALLYVREQISEVQLWVVGDGPMRAELERYVQQVGLSGNISFFGRVAEKEKIRLLHTASVFVSPSIQEGFGIVLLEAMACGLPIVALDLPVYHEFIDFNSGTLIPLRDSYAMAEQIVRFLMDDEARARMSAHNLAHVQQFDWDKMAEEEEQLLNEIVYQLDRFTTDTVN